jgi:hypothetical protein
VIVTGSRKWYQAGVVYEALDAAYRKHGSFVLVHGDCATGADAMAHHWYLMCRGVIPLGEDKFPAAWETGRAAGPERNERMVKAGADLVLAFPLPEGSGTQHTMSLARAAGIEVIEFKEKGAAP